jgi:hypothetical protein
VLRRGLGPQSIIGHNHIDVVGVFGADPNTILENKFTSLKPRHSLIVHDFFLKAAAALATTVSTAVAGAHLDTLWESSV